MNKKIFFLKMDKEHNKSSAQKSWRFHFYLSFKHIKKALSMNYLIVKYMPLMTY